MTTAGAAQALGVTEQTVRNWIHSGRLPATKIGGILLVPATALDEIEASCRPGPAPYLHHAVARAIGA